MIVVYLSLFPKLQESMLNFNTVLIFNSLSDGEIVDRKLN